MLFPGGKKVILFSTLLFGFCSFYGNIMVYRGGKYEFLQG